MCVCVCVGYTFKSFSIPWLTLKEIRLVSVFNHIFIFFKKIKSGNCRSILKAKAVVR